jgi:hypothetical protein
VCETTSGERRAPATDNNAIAMNRFNQRWMRAEIAIAITLALFGVLLLWNPSGLYLWLKAFHVIAVIAWMAGTL